MKLIHGKSGRGARPMGFPCTFVKPEGGVCGEVFESAWFLKKHKNQDSHFVPRAKKDK